jgi:hypothetical protein
MRKIVLTLEILNGVTEQAAFEHGVKVAQRMIEATDLEVVNPFVGIEVRNERASAAVQAGPFPWEEARRKVCDNGGAK